MKKLIGATLIVGLVTFASVGVASAQTGGSGTSPSSAPSATGHKGHRGVARGVLSVTARTLDLKARDVVSALCSGKTLAQLASEHGKSTSDLVSALVKAADARVDAAVKAGRISSAQAATRKSKLESRANQLVTSFQPKAARCQRLQGSGAGASTSPTT